jgi:hypothetical protein
VSDNVEDFGKHRDARDAHQYRLAQATYYLFRFEQANGRPAATNDELFAWVNAQSIKAGGPEFESFHAALLAARP